MPPLAVLVAVPPLLLFLAVWRRASTQRLAGLRLAQERWAADMDLVR